jgi:hypothetical protein
MAVVDEKLICRLFAEVKEVYVDIFGEDGVKTPYRKNLIILSLIVSIIQSLEFAFMLQGVGIKIIKKILKCVHRISVLISVI